MINTIIKKNINNNDAIGNKNARNEKLNLT